LGWAQLLVAGNGPIDDDWAGFGLVGIYFLFVNFLYTKWFSLFQDIANVLKKSASNILFFNGLPDPWSTGG